jgi:hypothetical protein
MSPHFPFEAMRKDQTIGRKPRSAMRNRLSIVLAGVAVATAAVLTDTPGWAASVKEILENYGLLGTFAPDCSQPASSSNPYIVYRVIDAGHVQRDAMTASTTRLHAHIIDSAIGTGPNAMEASGANIDGKPVSIVMRIEGQRFKNMSWVEDGKTIIADGLQKERNNSPMPWENKCVSQ